jgi:signal transduction histidine kinase
MRRVVGAMRRSDPELAITPQAGLDQLDRLVGQIRGAGLPVTVEIEGEPVHLAPGLDLAAYRIVQEGLTNALKHAGPATAHVTLRYAPDAVEILVADDGRGAAGGTGGGHGLIGMRERVAMFGGEIASEDAPEGGHVLRARLPLDGDAR